jgi:hypothetical protein
MYTEEATDSRAYNRYGEKERCYTVLMGKPE